jgi:helix-turn-helix protein
MTMQDDALLNINEVAARLNISPRAVKRLLARDDLAVVRIDGFLRFRACDIDAYIDAHRTPPIHEPRPRPVARVAPENRDEQGKR